MFQQLTVTTGITGGFIPAIPSRIVVIRIENGKSNITQSFQSPNGNVQFGMGKYLQTTETIDPTVAKMEEQLEKLKQLPVENPAGSQDIYGLDIGIWYEDPNFEWKNTPNEGCSVGISSVQPTEEQIKLFSQVVDFVHNLADKYCK